MRFDLKPDKNNNQEEDMVKKIFFDMDGVLADFNRGVMELCHMNPLKQGGCISKEEDDLMWKKIREVDHFYDRLEPMKGAVEMFHMIYSKFGSKCEILTGIPKPKRGIIAAGEDKISWAHRLLAEDLVVNIVYREEKKNYCTGKDCILIDDLASNIEAWCQYGGYGILHVSSENTIKILKNDNIL